MLRKSPWMYKKRKPSYIYGIRKSGCTKTLYTKKEKRENNAPSGSHTAHNFTKTGVAGPAPEHTYAGSWKKLMHHSWGSSRMTPSPPCLKSHRLGCKEPSSDSNLQGYLHREFSTRACLSVCMYFTGDSRGLFMHSVTAAFPWTPTIFSWDPPVSPATQPQDSHIHSTLCDIPPLQLTRINATYPGTLLTDGVEYVVEHIRSI